MRLARPLAGLISCGALVALSAGTSQAATPSTKLRSVSSPPATTLAPGAGLTVSGRLTNRTRRNTKARVTLTLQSRKRGVRAISIGGKSSSRIKAGRTARFRLSVKLPAGLAGGSYYLRACARILAKPVRARERSGEATPDLRTTHSQVFGDGDLAVPVAKMGGCDRFVAVLLQQAREGRPRCGSYKSVLVE